MQWIKSMGRQLLQGNLNLVNTSFPVLMFEPRSYLQKMADVWAYPDLVNAAAAQQDPLERMKLLVAWLVAGENDQNLLTVYKADCVVVFDHPSLCTARAVHQLLIQAASQLLWQPQGWYGTSTLPGAYSFSVQSVVSCHCYTSDQVFITVLRPGRSPSTPF